MIKQVSLKKRIVILFLISVDWLVWFPHPVLLQAQRLLSLWARRGRFDRVQWAHLFKVFKTFGLGKAFIAWVKLWYHSPSACIQTNYSQLDYFPTNMWKAALCLLFLIAIEPLSLAPNQPHYSKAVGEGGMQHHVSLYASCFMLVILKLFHY